MFEKNVLGQILADVAVIEVHGGLFGNVVQTDFAVTFNDGFDKEENMVSVDRAVSHVRT